MFIVLGAAGNVGSEVIKALIANDHHVIGLVHSDEKAAALSSLGVEPVVGDVADLPRLRELFKRGRRAFVLNPPGDPSGDSEAAELSTGQCIAAALEGSGLEKVVLASTYGAQEGEAIGDLSTLYALERAVIDTGIPAAINRAAYYFSNLDMLVDAAKEGVLPTAFPADFTLPMVDAADLGRAAAERLTSDIDDIGIRYVEGPARYSFADVGASLSSLLGRSVEVATTPRPQWEQSFRAIGFSEASARSFARMTAATIEAPDRPDNPWRGKVTLEDHFKALLARRG